MPIDRLQLVANSALGGDVMQAIAQVKQSHAAFDEVFSKLVHLQDGSNYSGIEVATGLDNGVGLGALLFAEMNSVQAKLNVGDPGAAVKAAVDQAVAIFG
jgi:hypothetical protein